MLHFRVDEREPACEDGAEGHVRPNITVHRLSGDEERNQDHEDSVRHGTVEGVKHLWRKESVVRLMALPVNPRRELVLPKVHERLKEVVYHQLHDDVLDADPTIP